MDPTLQMFVVVAVMVATFVLLIKEWIPSELAALAGLACLLVCGILDEKDVGGIFSNAAPLTIAAMFVLSEALVRTGVVEWMAERFQKLARGSEVRALVFLGLIVMPASAFLNNTPVVVVFLPVVIATCRATGLKATRLLIPLSFLSILGGTTTLLGTSTNLLVAAGAADAGQPVFTIFEITPLGVIYAIVGSLYMFFIGRHLLPAQDTLSSTLDLKDRRRFYSAIEIAPTSPLVGQRLVESALVTGGQRISIYRVVRLGRRLPVSLEKVEIAGGDVLWVRTSTKGIAAAQSLPGVSLLRRRGVGEDGEDASETDVGELLTVEAIVGPESSLIGKTVREARLRQRYGVLVAALHRRGRNLKKGFEDIPMAFGDTLILEGPVADIVRLSEEDDILSLQELNVETRNARMAPVAIAVLLGVVLASALGFLAITSAAIIGAVIVVLSRCLDMRAAIASIDWKILFLIYGMLGVGRGMEKSGVAKLVAERVTAVCEPAGPLLILVAIYLLASILTEVVTNNAVAIIMTPVVIGIAGAMGVDPRPFIVAIMFGASASFITPIGYQTNTYVYGAGNYRFRDFVKIGLPLNLILAVVAAIFIPKFWPF